MMEADKPLIFGMSQQIKQLIQLKARSLETQEEWMLQLESESRKELIAQCKDRQARGSLSYSVVGQSFPFNSDIWLTGWGPRTLGGQSTQCTYLNANLIQKHPQRNIQNNAWPVSGHPVAQSSWHIKWIITPRVLDLNPFNSNSTFLVVTTSHSVCK